MCVCVYIKNQFDKGKNPGKVGDFIGQKMREHGYFVEREKRKSTQILARNNFSNILLHYTFFVARLVTFPTLYIQVFFMFARLLRN